MDLLEIWTTWIFDRYEGVKESLTYTFHFLFTQPCDASDGNYFLSSGQQTFVFIKAVSKICSEQCQIQTLRQGGGGGGWGAGLQKIFFRTLGLSLV